MKKLLIALTLAVVTVSVTQSTTPATSTSAQAAVIDTRLNIIINSFGLSKIDTRTPSGTLLLVK